MYSHYTLLHCFCCFSLHTLILVKYQLQSHMYFTATSLAFYGRFAFNRPTNELDFRCKHVTDALRLAHYDRVSQSRICKQCYTLHYAFTINNHRYGRT